MAIDLYGTISKNGDYKVIKKEYSALPSGETVPPTYIVQNIVTGEDAFSTESESDALNYAKQVGGSSEKPNVASTKSTEGRTVETNPPKPPQGVNSSNAHQKDGASLPKPSQGILANTATSINNLIPAHGCPIKMQVLFDKFEAGMKQLIAAETSALTGLGTWMGSQILPVIEKVKEVVNSIKNKIKELQRYIDKLKEFINDIKEFMKEVQELISAIMSLPQKLMNLVANCMQSLQNSLSGVMKSQMNAISKSTEAFNNASNAQSQSKSVESAASSETSSTTKSNTTS